MAQVSTPPERMMHRFEMAALSSPPVRVWIEDRADSNVSLNACCLSCDDAMVVVGLVYHIRSYIVCLLCVAVRRNVL